MALMMMKNGTNELNSRAERRSMIRENAKNIRYFSFLSFITPITSSHERTQEELDLVFDELLHIPALSHLSTSIKRELASIIVFESHPKSGTVREYFK